MPNWCVTDLIIAGDKSELEKLEKLIGKWTSKEYSKSKVDKMWLGNIVLGAGFKTFDEARDGFRCRGSIVYIGEVERAEEKLYSLEIEYESAWEPMIEMWYAVIKKYTPHCRLYWYAEEPGFELYQSNDENHIFFDVEYAVTCWVKDDNKFSKAGFENGTGTYTKEGLTDMLRKVYGEKTLDEMRLLVTKDVEEWEDEFLGIYDIEIV